MKKESRHTTPEYKAYKREYDIKYRAKNKDKINARRRAYAKTYKAKEDHNKRNRVYYDSTLRDRYLANPALWLWKTAKKRAVAKGLDFNLDLEDILIPEVCPIFNTPLLIFTNSLNSASLDRKDNSKGYIKGNVAVISRRANILKSNMNTITLQRMLEYVNS